MDENVALAAATASFPKIHHPLNQLEPGTHYNKEYIKHQHNQKCMAKLTTKIDDNEQKVTKDSPKILQEVQKIDRDSCKLISRAPEETPDCLQYAPRAPYRVTK